MDGSSNEHNAESHRKHSVFHFIQYTKGTKVTCAVKVRILVGRPCRRVRAGIEEKENFLSMSNKLFFNL